MTWACFASAQTIATNALRFNGTNQYVNISHFSAFNSLPFTVAAWIRTTNINTTTEPVVSKYFAGGLNGWSVHTTAGNIRAWFYRDSANYINPTGLGMDGGFIADGRWHHIAFTVDTTGARILVDGVVTATAGWTGTAGAPTTSAPLHIGAIANWNVYFRGDADEVSVWNQALDTAAVNYIKYRSLGGRESGLTAYWRLDEGTGILANDSGPSARTGTLVNGAAWIPSTAPVALFSVARSAVTFDGVDDQVAVAHAADLDAYPLTVTAWIRTTKVAASPDAIVNKYIGASGNGWSLHLFNGRLAAFYFRDGANHVYTADPGFDGGFVADGNWHHVALTVDASGGKIFVDGTQRGALGWTGTPGPCTAVNGVLIGRYPSFTTLLGQIDEVSIWNRSLTGAELQAMQNLPLAGTEANLVAYWRFNENAGTTSADLTGLGHTATLQNGTTWVGSLARLGDGSDHVVGSLDYVRSERSFAIATSPNMFAFPFDAIGALRHFYDFGPAPAAATVDVTLSATMTDAASQTVPLTTPATLSYQVTLPSLNANASTANSYYPLSNLLLVDPVQLDSVNGLYGLTASLTQSVNGGPAVADGTVTLPPARFLDFNGHIFFGSVDTIFTAVDNSPARGTVTNGHVATVLNISANAGYLAGSPSNRYGNESLNVVVFPDGHAEVLGNPFVAVSHPRPDDTVIANLTLRRESVYLSSSGLQVGFLLLMPAGMGVNYGTGTTNDGVFSRAWYFDFVNTGPDLMPPSGVLAESYPMVLVDETKPFRVTANRIEWDLNAGTVTFPAPLTLSFVRQDVDDEFSRNGGVGPAMRISNDGYFKGVVSANGPMTVRGDSSGFARVNLDVNLPATEFRPHFPFSPREDPGIVTTGGRLVYSDRTVDIVQSAIQLADSFPVSYARDCAETNCGGISTTGAARLQFTADANRLTFTADGGLMANGTVPSQELTWGYGGGSNFAQRAATVDSSAFLMPGTVLRGENTALASEVRPGVLLFSGFGGPSADYDERPGELEYAEGLANYAGVNFRGATQGRSMIANTLTAWYPLTSRAKYYARFGGISGIHEADTFAGNLLLYGYPFTFTGYRLSYQDSATYESRTDGQVTVPFPSQFSLEFAEMKFLCGGGLDSARVAPNSGEKHLAYWNVDFVPLSIQFRGQKGDGCATGARTLVLGVEARLPFIPQRLHAALGFKSNGNLATVADNVDGCDSRFAVPPRLSLQGPSGGSYTVSTAGEGYFNSWSAGTTDPGFFNIVGALDLPYFMDSKVHLHVVPITASLADVYVMGGWRSSDKEGTDYGWTVGGKNYFNTSKFDRAHRGYPVGVTLDAYRNSLTEKYHPRAQQEWLDIVKFDYGLAWNKATHRFSSVEVSKVVLPVIDVDSRLKDLSPGKIDIEFAQDINVAVPELKLLDLKNEANGELNRPLLSFSNAVYRELREEAAPLTAGFNSMQRVLRDQVDGFFRPVLDPTLTAVANTLYPILSNAFVTEANFLANVSNTVAGAQSGLRTAVSGINGTTNNINSVFGQLNRALTDMDDTLGLFQRVVAKDPTDGTRHVVRAIIQKIVQDQGPELGLVIDTASGLADSLVNDLLRDLEPTLDQIEKQLGQARAQLNQYRAQLAVLSGQLTDALNSIANNAQALDNYLGFAGTALSNLMAIASTSQKDFFTANPDAAKQQIKEQLFTAFLNSIMSSKYHQAFKQFLYDDNALVNQIMETLFQQINLAVRNGVQSQLINAQDGVFKNFKGPGLASGSLLAARIRGAPTFNGDALEKIRLDANINMKLPDDMTFNAFLEVKQLSSANTPIGCIPAGAPSAEVTLGANQVPLGWAGVAGDPKVNVAARWSLQNGAVYGVAGSIGLQGGVDLKGVHFDALEAALAIGQYESYFAGRAAGRAKGGSYSFGAEMGLFAGKACRPDPLKLADPKVEEVLANLTDFSGIYLQYGGVFPFSQLIGIPPSCALRADGSASYSFYYRGGPRLGTVGGRLKLGLDVELLCVVGGHVDYSAALQASASELSFTGSANVCAKIGICPFCTHPCVGITIKGVVNDGGVDYFVDF